MATNNRNSYTPCQYLNSSAQELIDALNHYSNVRAKDILKSLSYIHKAWDSLWMTDVFLNQPLVYLGETGKQSYTLAACLNAYGKNKGSDKVHLSGKGDDAFPEVQYYAASKATGLFQRLSNGKTDPFYQNLDLIREIRNLDQHLFVKPLDETKASLVKLLNPYLLASAANYLEIYQVLHPQTLNDCKCQHSQSSRCDYKSLKKTNLLALENSLSLPSSISTLLEPISSDMWDYKTLNLPHLPQIIEKISTAEKKIESSKDKESIYYFKRILNPYTSFFDVDRKTYNAKLKESFNFDVIDRKVELKKYSSIFMVDQVKRFFKDFRYSSISPIVKNINASKEYPYHLTKKDLLNLVKAMKIFFNIPSNQSDNIFEWTFKANDEEKEMHLYSRNLEFFVTEVLVDDENWKRFIRPDEIPKRKLSE